jgi:hypothetical protein
LERAKDSPLLDNAFLRRQGCGTHPTPFDRFFSECIEEPPFFFKQAKIFQHLGGPARFVPSIAESDFRNAHNLHARQYKAGDEFQVRYAFPESRKSPAPQGISAITDGGAHDEIALEQSAEPLLSEKFKVIVSRGEEKMLLVPIRGGEGRLALAVDDLGLAEQESSVRMLSQVSPHDRNVVWFQLIIGMKKCEVRMMCEVETPIPISRLSEIFLVAHISYSPVAKTCHEFP